MHLRFLLEKITLTYFFIKLDQVFTHSIYMDCMQRTKNGGMFHYRGSISIFEKSSLPCLFSLHLHYFKCIFPKP